MLLLNPAVECEDGCGIVRHPVVRPGSEMEVGYFERTLRAASQLQGRTHTNQHKIIRYPINIFVIDAHEDM